MINIYLHIGAISDYPPPTAELEHGMPFTPLHMGIAFASKPMLGRHLSVVVFGISQIAMDIEVLLRMMLGIYPLHGYTNNLLGSSLLALFLIPTSRPISHNMISWWNKNLDEKQSRILSINNQISTRTLVTSVLLGVYSHWFLDAVMHSDSNPLYPFSELNPIFGLIPIDTLNLCCIALFFAGVALMYMVLRTKKTRIE
jgi:hypothetical protein